MQRGKGPKMCQKDGKGRVRKGQVVLMAGLQRILAFTREMSLTIRPDSNEWMLIHLHLDIVEWTKFTGNSPMKSMEKTMLDSK